MIAEIVAAWHENKSALGASLKTSHPDSYTDLVKRLVVALNVEMLDADRIAVVDHGDYQGTEIYLIANKTYQPDERDYVWFDNHYGSCSGL